MFILTKMIEYFYMFYVNTFTIFSTHTGPASNTNTSTSNDSKYAMGAPIGTTPGFTPSPNSSKPQPIAGGYPSSTFGQPIPAYTGGQSSTGQFTGQPVNTFQSSSMSNTMQQPSPSPFPFPSPSLPTSVPNNANKMNNISIPPANRSLSISVSKVPFEPGRAPPMPGTPESKVRIVHLSLHL